MSKSKDALERLAAELRKLRELVSQSPPISALLARKDVLRRYGICRSTLYRWLEKGFPRPVRGSFWRPADLDAWDRGRQSGQSQPG